MGDLESNHLTNLGPGVPIFGKGSDVYRVLEGWRRLNDMIAVDQNTVPEFPSESFSRRMRLSKKITPRSIRDSYRSVISVSNPCQA